MPTTLVYDVPRILQMSLDTNEFFELIHCQTVTDEIPFTIPSVDVLSYFLLAENATKAGSPVHAWISMLPKEVSLLPFTWAGDMHGLGLMHFLCHFFNHFLIRF